MSFSGQGKAKCCIISSHRSSNCISFGIFLLPSVSTKQHRKNDQHRAVKAKAGTIGL
jgi:hypothetical protein